MKKLDGKFALGCGLGTDHPQIHIFQCMLERTGAIKKEVLKPVTFFLAYSTVVGLYPSQCFVKFESYIR